MPEPRTDLARLVFSVLVICGLIIASLWVMAPFIAAIVWATTIVIATWPVLLRLQAWLGGRRALATAVMTLSLLGIVFVPFLASVGALVASADEVAAKAKAIQSAHVPPPPDWVARIPLVGAQAASAWQAIAGEGIKELAAQVAPYATDALKWFGSKVGGIGATLVQFLLTIGISALLYTNGESAADRVRRFARRLAGERGEAVVRLAGQAIRGVALGVVVTAVGQSLAGGLGLLIAGVPFAAGLTVVMFILCIAQLGPLLVMVPAVVWLYWSGNSGWGTFLLVWSLVVGLSDNFVRPILIKKGADLPLLLIFSGVIGGLVTLGLIGIFVGPVLLAVSHTLLEAWIDEGGEPGQVKA